MPKNWTEGFCNETAGFLFKHDCQRPATGRCVHCARPLCEEHSLAFEDGGVACRECLQGQAPDRDPGDRGEDHWYHESRTYYPGYGVYYHSGGHSMGHSHSSSHSHPGGSSMADEHDPNDFSPADAESLEAEGDDEFESDMGAS